MNTKTNLIAICGKSGAGKDALLQTIISKKPELNLLISDTTRPMRGNEEDGINYNFISKKEFDNKKYLEYTVFNNWLYGTPEDSIDKTKINIGVFNLEGIIQLQRNTDINLKTFYVSTDDKTRLLRQLNREPFPNVQEICRRFFTDEKDFEKLKLINYRFLRNEIEKDLSQCADIVLEYINELQSDSGRMS